MRKGISRTISVKKQTSNVIEHKLEEIAAGSETEADEVDGDDDDEVLPEESETKATTH